MDKIKKVPIDELEITFEDDPIKLKIKDKDFRPIDMPNLFILGGNSMEGREETTFWKDKAKMEECRLQKLKEMKENG